MRYFRKSCVVLSVLLCMSCSSDDTTNDEQNQNRVLIFGWFADDSCSGDCASIYKIDNENIYQDIDFNFPEGDVFQGNFQLMQNANYENFEGLINQLPNELLSAPNGYLDCTDCTDELGGFYLEYKVDGIIKTWRARNAQFPDYFESYRSLLVNKLAELNSL